MHSIEQVMQNELYELKHFCSALSARISNLEHDILVVKSSWAELQSKSNCRLSSTDGKLLPGLPSQDAIKSAIIKIGEEEMAAIMKSFNHLHFLW